MIQSIFFPPLWQQALWLFPWEWVLAATVAGFVWTAVKLIRREGLTR